MDVVSRMKRLKEKHPEWGWDDCLLAVSLMDCGAKLEEIEAWLK